MRCKDHRYLRRVVFGCALLFLCVAFLGSFFPIPANALSEKTDIAELKRKAEAGDAKAQNSLGFMYYNGFGVSRDYVEAVRWYRKASEQGLPQAQSNLGFMYWNGVGVNKDPGEAVKWFRKAARQGHKKAQDKLNEMGVPFQEVREGDTKPSQAVVSEPSISIRRVTIKPAKVLAGSEFKMISEYTVHDEKNKGGQVSVRYRYKILKGEKSLFEKKDITLKPCRVSRNCEVSERLNASKKRGTYAIVVTLTYRGHVAEKKVEFRIE